MLIILVFLIVMLIAIIRFDVHTVLARWIFFSIFGLVLAVFSLIVYSVDMWDYSYFVRKVLLLNNRSLYLWVYYLNLGTYTVIRFLNIGVATFLFCIACYSFEYYYSLKYTDRKKFVRTLLIFPLLYVLVYDPFITNTLYHLFFNSQTKLLQASGFFRLFELLNIVNKVWMVGYLLLALTMLCLSLKYAYHDRIKRKTIMLITNLATICFLYNIIFYWLPRILFTPRGLNIRGEIYRQPYVGLNIKFLGSPWYIILILFTLLSTAYFLVSIYKYNTISLSQKRKRYLFESAFKSANLSSRVFTHAFKNDLFAISTLSNIDTKESNQAQLLDRLKEINTVCNVCMERFDHLRKATSPTVNTVEKINVSQIVDEAVNLFSMTLPESIQIGVNRIPNLEVLVDKAQIVEVMRNLLVNAKESIKHENGKIEVSVLQKGRWAVMEVKDNGVGLTKDEQKHIFAPYFSTKPSTRNWGLGLSFSRRIVQLLDGDILVSSNPGKGSTFSIFLPILSPKITVDDVVMQ